MISMYIQKWAKALNRHYFSKKMYKRPVSTLEDFKHHSSLVGCKPKLQRDATSHPLGWLLSKKVTSGKQYLLARMWETAALTRCCGNIKWYRGFGETMAAPQRIRNRITVRFSNSLLGICSKELKAGS